MGERVAFGRERPFWMPQVERLCVSRSSVVPESRPSVAILTPCFFPIKSVEARPEDSHWGGGERYLVDLARLLGRLGFCAHAFQPSAEPWDTEVGGVPIHGLGVYGWGPYEFMEPVGRAFTEFTEGWTHRLYMNLDVAAGAPGHGIGLTHGVWWDQDLREQAYRYAPSEWREACRRAHLSVDRIVSVDTNSINWARAAFGSEVAGRMVYVPNYADEAEFPERLASRLPMRRGDRVRVLFPRRLQTMRGFELAVSAVRPVLDRWPNVEVRFVGHGPPNAVAKIRKLCAAYPGRVTYDAHMMTGMAEEYLNADIVLIPTVNCEGTSLSCIEAMAAGCAIVGTSVGGIADLLIRGHNGVVVEPTVGSLVRGIEAYLASPELAAILGAVARETYLSAFTKGRWEKDWTAVLRDEGWLRQDAAA